MPVDIAREADDLIRYYGELVRRLGQNGVRDIAELLALHEQLRRAVDAVSSQEIGWVAEQTQRLIGELVRMDSNLDSLRRLKTVMSGAPAPDTAPLR
jgi:DNA-binding GntR family transcriptional regulator